MKSILSKLGLSVLLTAAAMCMWSCEETPEPGNEEEGEKTVELSKPVVIQISGEFPVPHPEIPMEIYDGELINSADGVSVEMLEVTENNFKFACRPGKNVASYRIDVYPLAILYNNILINGGVGTSAKVVEDIIIASLFNATGNGGYSIDQDTVGEDYFEMVFDWANTSYAQQKIVPGCQYIIAVGACYDKSASESALTDLKLVYVETPEKDLVGNPMAEIDVKATYVGAEMTALPNGDAAGVYFYCTDTDAIDEFEDLFGVRLLRDFIRHGYVPNDPVPASETENLKWQIGPWTNVAPNHSFTAIAVTCDANLTPQDAYTRKDFTLQEKPEDREDAVLTYIVGDIVGASYLELDVTLGKECRNGYHLILPMDYYSYDNMYAPAREYIEGSESMKRELRDMIAQYGYAIHNENFSFDQEKQEPNGSEFKTIWPEYGSIIPDAEYVIAYCGMNAFNELTDISFSEPFRTKARVEDRPQDCKANAKLAFTDITPSGARFVVTYDPANTANIWFINISMNNQLPPYVVPEMTDSRQDWVDWFFAQGKWVTDPEYKDVYPAVQSYMNQWWRSPSGEDSFAYTGFDARSTFKYAYVAEDLDGVVSEVMFAEFTTGGLAPGPDPTVEIVPTYNPEDGTWSVKFNSIKDVATFKYLVQCDDDNALYLHALPSEPGGPSDMRAFEFYNHWFQKVGDPNYGGLNASTGYLGSPYTTDLENAGKMHLAGCVAFGENEDGTQSISKLFYWILPGDGSEPRKLSWYFPNYVEK